VILQADNHECATLTSDQEQKMEYSTIEYLTKVARVRPEGAREHRLLRRERLYRFADVLDRFRGRVTLLTQAEYLPESERMLLRDDQSPLTLAFNDPVLRAEGLEGDHYGDAVRFFQLTQWEAHELLCDCHYTVPITSGKIARRARLIGNRQSLGELWERARIAFATVWRSWRGSSGT
jgi:hypothetical protein